MPSLRTFHEVHVHSFLYRVWMILILFYLTAGGREKSPTLSIWLSWTSWLGGHSMTWCSTLCFRSSSRTTTLQSLTWERRRHSGELAAHVAPWQASTLKLARWRPIANAVTLSVPCRNLELPISIQDSTKKQKYLDTYKVSSNNIMHLPPLCIICVNLFVQNYFFRAISHK